MFSEIAVLVLAAGSSHRMKMPKLFMDFAGLPLLFWCLKTIQKLRFSHTILVLGDHYQDAIFTLSLIKEFHSIDIVINHNFSQGMSTTLKTGISVVPSQAKAALIFLADMPFLSADIIFEIVNTYKAEKEDTIVVPTYNGNQGHPVLLPRCYFQEIEKLEGDKGAKKILQKNQEKVFFLQSKTSGVLIDIDTKEEYLKWKNMLF